MKRSMLSTIELGLNESVELLNQSFHGYQIPLSFTLSTLLHSCRVDGIDLSVSQVLLQAGEPVGIALIARRGWRCRLAAMALVPAVRGQGVGRWFLTELVEQAKARNERQMVLEVIANNDPAVQLYQRCGFAIQRRLVSYKRPAMGTDQPPATDDLLQAVDLQAVATLVTCAGLPDLPWQLSGESLAQVGPPNCGYRLGGAYIALSDPTAATVAIRALVVEPASRGRGAATRLLQTITAAYPAQQFEVPALCPAELGGLFAKAGFHPATLAQWQMALDLRG